MPAITLPAVSPLHGGCASSPRVPAERDAPRPTRKRKLHVQPRLRVSCRGGTTASGSSAGGECRASAACGTRVAILPVCGPLPWGDHADDSGVSAHRNANGLPDRRLACARPHLALVAVMERSQGSGCSCLRVNLDAAEGANVLGARQKT